MSKVSRGPSKAQKDAEKYFAKNPESSAAELAKRFGVALSTIYRADWFKRAKEATK